MLHRIEEIRKGSSTIALVQPRQRRRDLRQSRSVALSRCRAGEPAFSAMPPSSPRRHSAVRRARSDRCCYREGEGEKAEMRCYSTSQFTINISSFIQQEL